MRHLHLPLPFSSFHNPLLLPTHLSKSQLPISKRAPWKPSCPSSPRNLGWTGGGWRRKGGYLRASMRESPYDVLGVSSSATPQDIKRAYRKLALKFHPDVNKEPNAQEKFMRIKHAYNTLINSKEGSSYRSTRGERNKSSKEQEEEFYGFGNFVRDVQITIGDFFQELQEEFQRWDANADSQGKPKGLWEELADIGEEFVEFLEKELNIENDGTVPQDSYTDEKKKKTEDNTNGGAKKSSIDDNIDEIEAALAQLKRELGL